MNASTPQFNLVSTPLERGVTLLEASAGTGKTYNLAGIVLRLLVEPVPGADEPLRIEQIVVVTFTEAATAELRERIRSRIVEAIGALETGVSTDGLLQHWLTEMPTNSPECERARRRLEIARRNFDLATICTIHGFSQRVLRDRAFESGALFDVELVTDQSELIQAATDDWWRKNFGEASPLHAAFAALAKLSPSGLAGLVKSVLRYPDLRVVTDAGEQGAAGLWGELQGKFTEVGELWKTDRAKLRAQFGADAKWANKPFNRDAEMDAAFAAVDRLFAGNVGSAELEGLLGFGQSLILAAEKKKQPGTAPQHDFFTLCDELSRLAKLWAVAVQREGAEAIREQLAADKLERKVQSFDDLLTRTRAALRSPAGPALVAGVRRSFGVALIDEFQDTDPVQWEIFSRLFGPDETTHEPAPLLFLIGDPKQAIYGFRGADVFTYLAAAETAARRYSLATNFRSERPLVHAVNAVFDGRDDAFVIDGIRFEPVAAAERAEATPLKLENKRPESLVFWMVPREDDGKVVDKGAAGPAIIAAVVGEILRLLSGAATVDGRPLQPRQIAVLVRKNDEAEKVHAALATVGVPAVRMTQESVFASIEATELFRVLSAMADPGHEGFLRAVAAIDWMGGQVITGAADDEAQVLTTLREQLKACRVTWETRGFAPAFRRLFAESGARAKLLRRPDGERALTNLLHLGQLLHTAADSEGRGVGALLSWFARHLNGDGVTTDEQLLRLERDDEAVQIVTMHRSKGLEYDVVFCPFCWEGESNDQRLTRHGLQVHDADAHERQLHLGPDFTDELKAQRRREELAENLRLFYVALTRAKRRCYVAWGALKAAETSAPAWLLHRDKATRQPWPVSFSALSDDAMRAELQALVQAAKLGKQTTIAVESLPTSEGPAFQSSLAAGETLAARTFTRRIADNWRVLAFTAMTSGADTEAPDYDSGSRPAETVAPTGMFAFPAGTRAGTCLHKIFERIDFPSAIQEPPREVIAEELRAHGIDATTHTDAVSEMLAEVLASELPGVGGKFQLADITATDRLNELGFHCPLRDVNAQRVAEVLKLHGNELPAAELPARIEELQFAASGGLLTGFIDLLVRRGERFYLLDWKSNWLGNAVSDYTGDKLKTAMLAHRYPLQYLLYTVAVNRWLTLRLGKGYSYERSFGGVFYLFLRGVNRKQPGAGVFADRPSQALIEDLSDVLLARPTFGGIAL